MRKNLREGFRLDVSFSVPAGITIVFGPSGAGKTTLLDCIAGLLTPDTGRISVGSRALFDSEKAINISPARRSTGYVFQTLALFPHLTAEQNIEYGLHTTAADERRRRVQAILESFRIAGVKSGRPNEISGGERQRVALARALVTDPAVLLLDEPLSALDSPTKAGIIADLRSWNEAHKIPVLYVTHSREELFALGERVLALEQGRVTAQGTPQEVLHAPRTESLALTAGFENIFDARVVSLHEQSGTMTCRIGLSNAELEVPLGHAAVGDALRIGIRAGDILVATEQPRSLSARNLLPARIVAIERRDIMVIARVDCGIELEVHLTPGAQQSLALSTGRQVWLVIKTYSCHLLR